MATKFIFVRHGQSMAHSEDIALGTLESPLSEIGKAQAHECAAKLQEKQPTVLYSSPLSRAWETATIIGAELGIKPIADERLRERFIGAALQGKKNSNIRSLLADEFAALEHQGINVKLGYRYSIAPDAETPQEAAQRMLDFAQKRSAEHPDAVVIAVTHAASLAALAIVLGKMEFKGPFASDGIANTAQFEYIQAEV